MSTDLFLLSCQVGVIGFCCNLSTYVMFVMGNWEKPLVVFCTDNLEFCICIFPFGFLHDFKDFCIVYGT